MPDYSKGKIYKIVSENNSVYIGSTTQILEKRMSQHKSKLDCSCYLLGCLDYCYIELIEEVISDNKEDLLKKEREYIKKYRENKIKVVNINNP